MMPARYGAREKVLALRRGQKMRVVGPSVPLVANDATQPDAAWHNHSRIVLDFRG